jgi:hypothetical protein
MNLDNNIFVIGMCVCVCYVCMYVYNICLCMYACMCVCLCVRMCEHGNEPSVKDGETS